MLRGAYGVRGWVRVQPHSQTAEVLQASRNWWLMRKPAREVRVGGLRRHGGGWVAKLEGVDTPEEADGLRGQPVGVPRSAFPPAGEGEVYWVDLIGCRVVNRNGDRLGEVVGMDSNGAQDLLRVAQGARVFLVPLIEAYVDEVDARQRIVRVDWEADW